MDTTSLSSADKKRMESLRHFVLQKKRFPSYSQLTNIFDVASKNAVAKILQRLQAAGFISKDSSSGTWTTKPTLTGIALHGIVGASFPSPAEEELADAITLDDYLIENKQSSFLLRVTGDSMTGAGIHSGDYVIVERGRTPQHNDIVIAQVDQQSTMKRFIKIAGRVELHAENSAFPPIIPTEELRIDGVVRGVIRKYS